MFLQDPHFAVIKKGRWKLTRDLIYHSQLIDQKIIVPKGFETDFASIPRFFQRVLPVNDDHRLAAVVHDYLYSTKGRLPDKNIDREMADKIFLEAMKVLNVSYWKRQSMYRAVRLFGWAH